MRYADVPANRPRWRINLGYGLTDRTLITLEYNPAVGEILPNVNHTLQVEDAKRPLINLGTSSDRIFSPEKTRSYYMTFAKGIPGTRLSAYASLNWSEWEDRLTFPFGLTYALDPAWDAMMQHDGRNTHWLLTYKVGATSTSFLLIKGRYPGISMGVKF